MALNRKLVDLIGRRIPQIYDVFPPQGLHSRLDAVALNPQPLPPLELGAALAREFTRSAWAIERAGGRPETMMEVLDDWCGTGPRRIKIKLPPWWPDPRPGFEIDGEDIAELHLGFAAQLSAGVPRSSDAVARTLESAIGRSIEAFNAVTG